MLRRARVALLLCGFVATTAIVAACANNAALSTPAGTSRSGTVRMGLHRRNFLFHVPRSYDGTKPLPLLVLLHGYGGDADGMESGTHFSDLADTAGLFVAYPDGEREFWFAGPRHWSAFGGDRTDVDFIERLMNELIARYHVDTTRLFVAGFSNGGYMSYRLGAELSDRLAAIGVVSGTIGFRSGSGAVSTIPPPTHAVSVIAMHGVEDPVVPYASARYGAIPVESSMAFWREYDACNGAPTLDTLDRGNLIVQRWSPCRDRSEVAYYSVQNGGHEWFMPHRDSTGAPDLAHDLNATEILWAFLSRQRRGRD